MSDEYFSELNYTLANEDNTLEVSLCDLYKPLHILTVCGSGGRALPLLSCNPETLVALDLVQEQLLLGKLREACFRDLTYNEFLLFWGYPPFKHRGENEQRKLLFNKLNLEEDTQKLFTDIFTSENWNSLLYIGKWEKTFITLSKIVQSFLPKKYRDVFECKTLEEQIKFYQEEFPVKRWKFILFFIGNKSLFNALLYKGNFVKKNIEESYWDYYKNAFEHLFTKQLVRESFFAQLCFLGEIKYSDGYTVEAREDVYNSVRGNIVGNKTKVSYVKNDLVAGIKESSHQLDFISMSNVPSYFAGEIEKTYLQDIKPHLAKDAIVIYRCYLRVPEVNSEGYDDITNKHKDLIEKEKVQMYQVRILRKI